MQVQSFDARDLTPDEALAIAELIVKVWPKPEKDAHFRQQQLLAMGRDFHGPDSQAPRSFVIHADGAVIAHAAVIPRTIGTSRGALTIAGLCRVCSDPAYRGQGLGEKVVRAAFQPVDEGIFPFSLFQTTPPVAKFYERFGRLPRAQRVHEFRCPRSDRQPFLG